MSHEDLPGVPGQQPDERSLQKRPDLNPQLFRGGLIVGAESALQGPLMRMTGFALERITRERTEVPPSLRLPERPVYLFDPNTKRLVMVSNREPVERRAKTQDKYGLFAEIVELDEEGNPHYRLATSDVILSAESYIPVAVGPNDFNLPPSHIEVIEAPEEETQERKFVPWNLWLGQLQNWMNKVVIHPGEDFATFVKRFQKLRSETSNQAENKIRESFPDGQQGIDKETLPANIILTDKGTDSFLYQESQAAGLYPFLVNPNDLAEFLVAAGNLNRTDLIRHRTFKTLSDVFLPGRGPVKEMVNLKYSVACISLDRQAFIDLQKKAYAAEENKLGQMIWGINNIMHIIQSEGPVFAIVDVDKPYETESPDKKTETEYEKLGFDIASLEPNKLAHGWYLSPHSEKMYRELLNKLKADLLLTMFVRGGAPMVK